MFEINPNFHKAVVIIEGNAYGFTQLHYAISFVEEINKGEDFSKLFNTIATALGDDKEDGVQIYDIDTYADLFMEDDDVEVGDEDDDV